MGEVNLSIHGKSYGIACDDGQEGRVADLGRYVDVRLREIAASGAASSDAHLLVLTALMMADEIYEMREAMRHLVPASSVRQRVSEDDERHIVEAIEHLAGRIDSVAARLQKIQ